MISQAIRTKLSSPDYLDGHLLAVAMIEKLGKIPWYDAHFHVNFELAKRYLAEVRPDALDRFVNAFEALKPSADFKPRRVERLFDASTHARIVETARSVTPEQFTAREEGVFGRHVVHDHPYFTQLQRKIAPLASELAGIELECGYNFLALYGGDGRCAPHLDEPVSMFTLDYCIEQNCDWPIHFSRVIDWPDTEAMLRFEPSSLMADPALEFESHCIEENCALLFCGSSQWHYRAPIPQGGYCNLLFWHFYPRGCDALVDPLRWPEHFSLPELEPLCDLFFEIRKSSENQSASMEGR